MSSANAQVTNSPSLLIKEISDIHVRTNFQNLADYFAKQNQLLNFNFFEVVLTKATANYTLAHGLKYIPADVIVTQCTGPGQVTFNYGLFDKTNVNLTTTDACRVRFFVGTYFNFQSSVQPNSTDVWIINPSIAGSITTTTSTGTATKVNIYTGSGIPSKSLGSVGDVYMDLTTGFIYNKSTSGWNFQLGPGGPVLRSNSTTSGSSFSTSIVPIIDVSGKPLSVSVNSTGRPLELGMCGDLTANASNIGCDQTPTDAGFTLYFYRDGFNFNQQFWYKQNNVSIEIGYMPSSAFRCFDTPSKGNHIYTVSISAQNNPRATNAVFWSCLYARELA